MFWLKNQNFEKEERKTCLNKPTRQNAVYIEVIYTKVRRNK
jgi:hypothetical protein